MGVLSVGLDCSELPESDLAVVDALARLRLELVRQHIDLRLSNPGEGLRDLIRFAGLAEVLCVEPGGEVPEREEALGVKEEGQLGDPTA
jgi:hypothetical protein